jgi:hypothetical protein
MTVIGRRRANVSGLITGALREDTDEEVGPTSGRADQRQAKIKAQFRLYALAKCLTTGKIHKIFTFSSHTHGSGPLVESARALEQFRIFSDVTPSEPWFGLMVGVFFLSSLVATFWLLFRDPNPRSDIDPRSD